MVVSSFCVAHRIRDRKTTIALGGTNHEVWTWTAHCIFNRSHSPRSTQTTQGQGLTKPTSSFVYKWERKPSWCLLSMSLVASRCVTETMRNQNEDVKPKNLQTNVPGKRYILLLKCCECLHPCLLCPWFCFQRRARLLARRVLLKEGARSALNQTLRFETTKHTLCAIRLLQLRFCR